MAHVHIWSVAVLVARMITHLIHIHAREITLITQIGRLLRAMHTQLMFVHVPFCHGRIITFVTLVRTLLQMTIPKVLGERRIRWTCHVTFRAFDSIHVRIGVIVQQLFRVETLKTLVAFVTLCWKIQIGGKK